MTDRSTANLEDEYDPEEEAFQAGLEQGRIQMRERAAKLIEKLPQYPHTNYAAAIRALPLESE